MIVCGHTRYKAANHFELEQVRPVQSAVVSGEGSGARARKTVKNQHGDPRFLEQVQKCVAQRRALLGLDAPTLVAPVHPHGTPLGCSPEVLHVVHELKLQLLEDREYLDYLRQAATDDDERLVTIPVQWTDDDRYAEGLIESRGKE